MIRRIAHVQIYCSEYERVRTRRKLFSSVEPDEDDEVEAMRSLLLLARAPPLRAASSSTESFGLASAAPVPDADAASAVELGAEFSLPIWRPRRRAAFFDEPFDEADLGDAEADLGDCAAGGGASSSLVLKPSAG